MPLPIIAEPFVESKALFIKDALKVKGHHMNISAANHPFQQRPEILQPIRVDLPAHIRFGMVDSFVNIVRIQPFIRHQQIGEHFRPDLGLNNPLAGIRYDFCLAPAGRAVAFQQTAAPFRYAYPDAYYKPCRRNMDFVTLDFAFQLGK